MAENDYTEDNVQKWNLAQMIKIWNREIRARKTLLKYGANGQPATPLEMYTLLQRNRPGYVALSPEVGDEGLLSKPSQDICTA